MHYQKRWFTVEVCTGYPGPGISQDNPGVKNPGTLISEISLGKKSWDFCYQKILGFFNKIRDIPWDLILGSLRIS